MVPVALLHMALHMLSQPKSVHSSVTSDVFTKSPQPFVVFQNLPLALLIFNRLL